MSATRNEAFLVAKPLKRVPTSKEFMSNKVVEKTAREVGCHLRNGAGDHKIIEFDGINLNGQHVKGQTVYCQREMGRGLGCKIWKWFKDMGLFGQVITIFLIFCVANYFFDLGFVVPFLPRMGAF